MVDELHRLRNTVLSDSSPYSLSLYSLLYPWFVPDDYKTSETENAKAKFLEFNVNGDALGEKLEAVLSDDLHLKECCVNVLTFASLLDKIIGLLLGEDDQRVDDSEFDARFDAFVSRVYEEPFKAYTCSHVFNLSAYANSLDFENLAIQELAQHDIPILLGESTSFSFLHPYKSGEYFIVATADGIIENDLDRMQQAHVTAEQLVRIFQYYKDGVVHLNYTANFFRPYWVNSIRKFGMLFLGDNRRLSYEQGQRMYHLDADDHEKIKQWWRLFQKPEIQKKFGENRDSLGKTIEFAGSYFESSHTQTEELRALIDLSIALEAAFSPHNEGEISFQLSQLTAELVGSNAAEKMATFEFVKKMYGKRSDLLHGRQRAYEDDFVTVADLEKFSSIIRRGLLKFIALYINGEAKHKDVIEKIRSGLFDPEIRKGLDEKADINRLIRELVSTGNSG